MESDSSSWSLCTRRAVDLQKRLAARVHICQFPPRGKRLRLVAGCDVSYERRGNRMYAGIVVLGYPEMERIEGACAVCEAAFPYIPGLLSFRESPALLQAWRRLKNKPDVLMVDGHGIAHTRRLGIASHLGVVLDLPTIGCAKSRLIGTYVEPCESRASRTFLLDRGETIGAVVRTRDNVKPVFVSVGHRTTLDDAVRLVLESARGYRLPEPTRQAHILVNALRSNSSQRRSTFPSSKPGHSV